MSLRQLNSPKFIVSSSVVKGINHHKLRRTKSKIIKNSYSINNSFKSDVDRS